MNGTSDSRNRWSTRLGRLELVGDDGEELLLQRGEIRLLTVDERRVLRQPNGPIGRAAIR